MAMTKINAVTMTPTSSAVLYAFEGSCVVVTAALSSVITAALSLVITDSDTGQPHSGQATACDDICDWHSPHIISATLIHSPCSRQSGVPVRRID
jgi:hypothetical protein